MSESEMWVCTCRCSNALQWTGPLTAKPRCPKCGFLESQNVLEYEAKRHREYCESLAIIAEAQRKKREEEGDTLPDPDLYWERIY